MSALLADSVEECDAGVQGLLDKRLRIALSDGPAARQRLALFHVRVRHEAEADTRYDGTSSTEANVVHAILLPAGLL